jgi:hypothetical protein
MHNDRNSFSLTAPGGLRFNSFEFKYGARGIEAAAIRLKIPKVDF